MNYSDIIIDADLGKALTDVFVRYRPGYKATDIQVLYAAFLVLSDHLKTYRTDRFVKIDCPDDDWYTLEAASSYPRTLTIMESSASLKDPDKRVREVQIWKEFSDLCEEIARVFDRWQQEHDDTPIHTLGIDIETYSSNDIAAGGVYKYVEAEDFTVLLFAYSINGGPVAIVDLACGETLPDKVMSALTDPNTTKTAFNAAFERTCLNRYFGLQMDASQWDCTMVRAAVAGLPLSLDACGKALKLEQQKMSEGKALIKYFSCPCKPTKVNGGRTRNLPMHAPEKWETFKRYCIRDVEVEQQIRNMLPATLTTDDERRLYVIDQRINDRGVMVDLDLVGKAVRMDNTYKARLNMEAADLTGLDNPNSAVQLKAWLENETGKEVASISKKDMPDLLKSAPTETVQRMLQIRQEMSKTSTKKYEAMANAVCKDGRIRGLLQFYGTRTGRWAGRLVQVQNLPQNHIEDLDYARRLVKSGDLPMVEMMFGNVPDTLSQLIRTAFVAKEGHTFLVCDFSAIEARVIAWLAGEEWRLDVFRTHGKIYEASASMMFHVPVEEITKTDPRRQKGKIAELALGYGGGVGAMKQMGGERMGLSDAEMQDIVDNWRAANKRITGLWKSVEKAAMAAIRTGLVAATGCLRFFMADGTLAVRLPSGRCLSYPKPSIGENRFGSESICYDGVSQTTKQWCRQETYGGKLVENIVQAIARDCLAVTMVRLEDAGYPIVFHVHDECIVEAPKDGPQTLAGMEEIFKTPIPWAEGLPLKGAGYVTPYYLKD